MALVQYINRLCRHLAITPARLHPHEVYLDPADTADPRVSCLLSTWVATLLRRRQGGGLQGRGALALACSPSDPPAALQTSRSRASACASPCFSPSTPPWRPSSSRWWSSGRPKCTPTASRHCCRRPKVRADSCCVWLDSHAAGPVHRQRPRLNLKDLLRGLGGGGARIRKPLLEIPRWGGGASSSSR